MGDFESILRGIAQVNCELSEICTHPSEYLFNQQVLDWETVSGDYAMHGFPTASAITVLSLFASLSNANACKPISPGSSFLDCRTDAQIKQERERSVPTQKDEEERVARAAQQRQHLFRKSTKPSEVNAIQAGAASSADQGR